MIYICDDEGYYNEDLKVYVPDESLYDYMSAAAGDEWYYMYYHYLPLSEYDGHTPEIPEEPQPENPDA